MMKAILFFLLIFPFCPVQSQTNNEQENQLIEFICPGEPIFPGGKDSLYAWIVRNLEYPTCIIPEFTGGKVYVQFAIDVDGSVVDVKLRRGIDPYFDDLALQLFKRMPNWIPAEWEGACVKTVMQLPINFVP